MSNFPCPKPASISSISAVDCEVRFDQIVRIAFQRRDQTSFDEVTNLITASATWTPLLAAVDDTKVQFTPTFTGMVIPQSEALTEGGGDNTTINGVEEYLGEGPVKVELMFKGLTAAAAEELRSFAGESQANAGLTDLVGYFVNRHGDLIHNNLKGFDIYNFRLSSVGSEGYNQKNKYMATFSMAANWDKDFVITPRSELDFNPVTIKNA